MENTQFMNPHHEEDHLHTTTAGDHGDHEHKSVLKKVKDKAKKIKNKITHKHEHEHEHEHDLLTDEDEEDENDEEMEVDPEIHGAPIYESSVISGTNLPRQIDPNLEKPLVDVGDINPKPNPIVRDHERTHERPSTKIGDQLGIHPEHEGVYRGGGDDIGILHPYEGIDRPLPIEQDEGMHLPSSKIGPEFGTPLPTVHENENKNKKKSTEYPNVRIGTSPLGLEEDPHSYNKQPAPSNYESKVTDPTHCGGKEANVTPLVHSFDNLNVRDHKSSQPQSVSSYTGSHDQFAPEPMSVKDHFNPESTPKSFDSTTKAESMPQDTVAGKVSSATSTMAEKAAYAKNVVASKLGYGQETGTTHDTAAKKPVTELAAEYAHTVYDKVAGAGSAVMSKVGGSGSGSAPTVSDNKPTLTASVAEKLAPVYGTVAGAGSAVISKVKGQGQEVASDKERDKGVSMKEYFVEKMRPGEEDKALSEAITDALQKKKGGVAVVEDKEKPLPLGKVTESEEVARHLGSDNEYKREGEDAFAAGKESTGQGMVERVKDAVGLWLGKSTGTETAQQSVGQAHVSGAGAGEDSTVARGEEGKVQQKQAGSSY